MAVACISSYEINLNFFLFQLRFVFFCQQLILRVQELYKCDIMITLKNTLML